MNDTTPPTKDALLLRYIRRLHKVSNIPNDCVWDCAECGNPHPCETFRAAYGDPGWPRDADEVLAELDQKEPA